MSKKRKIVIGVVMLLLLFGLFFVGGYKYGLSKCKPCPQGPQTVVQKEAKKPVVVKKKPKTVQKPQQKVVKLPASVPVIASTLVPTPAPVPTPALVLIPALVPTSQKLILRLNVVEWSQIFEGESLMSRDIGILIRKGLADGTVMRATQSLMFNVNGAMVTVQSGQVVLDPGQIGPETAMVVQPSGNVEFASPPSKLPLVTEPGELDSLVKKGVRELWLNFILAPR